MPRFFRFSNWAARGHVAPRAVRVVTEPRKVEAPLLGSGEIEVKGKVVVHVLNIKMVHVLDVARGLNIKMVHVHGVGHAHDFFRNT